MSYYGVSVLVTILVTSLIAFYLLYKTKELNLGILISITTGSIVLGFSFSPAFHGIMELLSNNISLDKKITLVLALLIVLFIFLLFICILSFIISVAIPKRFSSVDCGIYIDKLFSKIKGSAAGISGKLSEVPSEMQDNVKNTYNLKNKLKKPVDTKEIIDTMGIEKCENGISVQEVSESNEVPEINDVPQMQEVLEINGVPQIQEVLDAPDVSEMTEEIPEEIPAYESVVIAEELETADSVVAAIETDMVNDIDLFIEDMDTVKIDNNITDEASDHIAEAAEYSAAVEIEPVEQRTDDSEYHDNTVITAGSLVIKAFESKNQGRKDLAVEYYIKALQSKPDKEMVFWIVLDVCALYKQLGLSELAESILEGMVERYGAIIQPEIREEILKNLK